MQREFNGAYLREHSTGQFEEIISEQSLEED